MKIIQSILFLSLLLISSLAICQQTRKYKDSVAKQILPIQEKAIVYIIRPSAFGIIIKMNVECDSIHIGSTFSAQYIYTILDPGPHQFISYAENKHKFDINLEGGKIYYLKQQVLPGLVYFRTKLKLMNEEDGKYHLSLCEISKENVFTKKRE